MDYASLILATAKTVKVSGPLLLAICSWESNLKNVTIEDDMGTPSYGVCQVKMATAEWMGYQGEPDGLRDPETNVYWAARFLKFQQDRYTDKDWCKLTAAYNAGSFIESRRHPGKPVNRKYVKLVQSKIEPEFKERLSCEPPKRDMETLDEPGLI